MQQGSLIKSIRKRGPDVWQFRWAERGPQGKRIYRKRVIGTVCQYSDADSARTAVTGLLTEINSNGLRRDPFPLTVKEVCNHFEQRELTKDNIWRSYSTKKSYKAYLNRWIIPHWGTIHLSEVRTIQVESWLRGLPLAKSSCAKIRNLFSVLFNHACRHELFDRNPIRLVRQGAKRRTTPSVLTPAEIKSLLTGLGLRERVLVLLAASTGLRQSELFGMKWCDIDFAQHTMNVVRSIVYGVVGPCKTESSQKPVPVHPTVLEELAKWRELCRYNKSGDWVFASRRQCSEANLGPGDPAQVYSSRRTEGRNSKAIRMAHFPAHVFDFATQRRDRIQSDAGVVAALLLPVNVGCLHSGNFARKARCAGSSPRSSVHR